MSCQPFSSQTPPGLSSGGYQVQMNIADGMEINKTGNTDPSGFDCTPVGCKQIIKMTFHPTDPGHFSQFATLEACQKICNVKK